MVLCFSEMIMSASKGSYLSNYVHNILIEFAAFKNNEKNNHIVTDKLLFKFEKISELLGLLDLTGRFNLIFFIFSISVVQKIF